jgi:hypothetical protein
VFVIMAMMGIIVVMMTMMIHIVTNDRPIVCGGGGKAVEDYAVYFT